jgi:hypothetical protein
MGNITTKTMKYIEFTTPDGSIYQESRIVFADDLRKCECCKEPYCDICNTHYSDCDCLGPSNAEEEGWSLVERDNVLYAIREKPTKLQPI